MLTAVCMLFLHKCLFLMLSTFLLQRYLHSLLLPVMVSGAPETHKQEVLISKLSNHLFGVCKARIKQKLLLLSGKEEAWSQGCLCVYK